MSETWKSLNGIVFCGENYEVSSLGNVRNIHTKKLLKGINRKGYVGATLYANGANKRYGVHRLVALVFIPNPENKPQVNHCDGDKTNNAVTNLEWATKSENQIHAVETGLQPVTKTNVILTVEQVKEIRKLYAAGGYTYRSLASDFGVGFATIRDLIKGLTWKDI